jgi:hypothetical protein
MVSERKPDPPKVKTPIRISPVQMVFLEGIQKKHGLVFYLGNKKSVDF